MLGAFGDVLLLGRGLARVATETEANPLLVTILLLLANALALWWPR
jgi:hypothetical protein